MNGWVPAKLAADVARLPYRTVQTWARRRHIASACRVADRALVVWWPDVHDRSNAA